MTAITNAHAEWAVVDRLRAMLVEPPHQAYNVTQSYALCVAILAWVMQRIRTRANEVDTPEARAAVTVKARLVGQPAEAMPWFARQPSSGPDIVDRGNFADQTAFDFLKSLRDAMCHGDARSVFPINRNGQLVGFEFRVMSREGIEWSATLKERDLRRIGTALAAMYCEALQAAVAPGVHAFVDEASSMREKRRAA